MSTALTDLLAEYHIDGDQVANDVRATLAAVDSAPPLTAGERAMLTEGGLDTTAGIDPQRELTRGLADAAEARRGYTAAEVASANHVQPGRVRSWASDRELVAVKIDGRNRYPRFQFDQNGRRIPGLAAVTPHKPARWTWRVWRNFLTTADPTYAGPDGLPATALDWLAGGGDPATVIALTRTGW